MGPRVRPRGTPCSGGDQARCELPKAVIDPHILADGLDGAGTSIAPGGRAAGQSAAHQVFLDYVVAGPDIGPGVGLAPRGDDLLGRHRLVLRVRVAHRERPAREFKALRRRQIEARHPLYDVADTAEIADHRQRRFDNIAHDVATMCSVAHSVMWRPEREPSKLLSRSRLNTT